MAKAARRLPELPWREKQPEPGPIRLGNRRLYILPTRAGLVYALLLLGLLVGAINYAVSLAYLFTFWFAALGVIGMLHTQRNLAGLSLHAEPCAPVFAGELAQCRLRIENPARLPRRQLRLGHPGGAQAVADIPANEQTWLTLELPQSRRGWQPIGRVDLSSLAPLGLFRCWSVLRLDWGVLVYPTPAATRRPLPEAEADGGEAGSLRRGDEEFHTLRDYQPGDSTRRIAWRTLARGGDLMTKQFAGSGGGAIWLDWATLPEHELEARLSRLTRWALDAHAAGLRFGLRLPGRQIDPDSGEAHLRRCLEALARHGLD
jgi:uncharacterized protein (DUF58 family)